MDLTDSIAPKSDQLNADDLIAGPITVTIDRVTGGSTEQPVNVHLVERPGRPYRPSKSMRRVLVIAWGRESDLYAGRRLTLYRNPDITFGREAVGGIEISHLSNIDGPLTMSLTATRGKKRTNTVQPLPDASPASHTMPELSTVDECREHYRRRQAEGASAQELSEITSVASALALASETADGE